MQSSALEQETPSTFRVPLTPEGTATDCHTPATAPTSTVDVVDVEVVEVELDPDPVTTVDVVVLELAFEAQPDTTTLRAVTATTTKRRTHVALPGRVLTISVPLSLPSSGRRTGIQNICCRGILCTARPSRPWLRPTRPARAGEALVVELPVVPRRPLSDYAIGEL